MPTFKKGDLTVKTTIPREAVELRSHGFREVTDKEAPKQAPAPAPAPAEEDKAEEKKVPKVNTFRP